MKEITTIASTPEETRRLGAQLGRVMGAGDVVALVGPLGGGKTTFAQGLAQGLDVPADRHVASPTFTLVSEHPGRVPFVHVDFYRLETADELAELGLDEAYDEAAVAIEWADRFWSALPPDHLAITFTADEGGRRLTARATGDRGAALLVALAASPPIGPG